MTGEDRQEEPLTAKRIWSIYRAPIILGAISLLLVTLSLVIFVKSFQPSAAIIFSSDQPWERQATDAAQMTREITVDVAGAVGLPGVYRLPPGSRVEDAITAAGGLTNDVDGEAMSKYLNRAARISDGAKLWIPKKGDVTTNAGQGIGSVGQSTTLGQGSVAVNAASQAELEALPGIGPVTAKKIIDARPYQTLEELVAKKAMSQSLFDKLKAQLSL